MVTRRALLLGAGAAALAGLPYAGPAAAAPVPVPGGNGLDALIARRKPAPGQWFKVNSNTIADVALRRSKRNFDGGAALGLPDTFADDREVARAVGSAREMYVAGYSKGSIDRESGRCFMPSQGHTDSLDSSLFVLDAPAGRFAWRLAAKGGRLLRFAEPDDAAHKPAWSPQILARLPGDQWITVTDADGAEQPHATHHYASDFVDPRSGVYYQSGAGGGGNPATSAVGAVWKFDPATGRRTIHWKNHGTGDYGGVETTRNGFVAASAGNSFQSTLYDPLTGRLLFVLDYHQLFEIVQPTGSAPRVQRKSVDGRDGTRIDIGHASEMCLIPDPAGGSRRVLFTHRADDAPSAEFVLFTELRGFGFREAGYRYANDPTRVLRRPHSMYDSWDHNEVDGRILLSQGDRTICKIDYAGIEPARWELVKMTGEARGVGGPRDLPPADPGQCRIRYLKGCSARTGMELYGLVTRGDYFIYRAR